MVPKLSSPAQGHTVARIYISRTNRKLIQVFIGHILCFKTVGLEGALEVEKDPYHPNEWPIYIERTEVCKKVMAKPLQMGAEDTGRHSTANNQGRALPGC